MGNHAKIIMFKLKKYFLIILMLQFLVFGNIYPKIKEFPIDTVKELLNDVEFARDTRLSGRKIESDSQLKLIRKKVAKLFRFGKVYRISFPTCLLVKADQGSSFYFGMNLSCLKFYDGTHHSFIFEYEYFEKSFLRKTPRVYPATPKAIAKKIEGYDYSFYSAVIKIAKNTIFNKKTYSVSDLGRIRIYVKIISVKKESEPKSSKEYFKKANEFFKQEKFKLAKLEYRKAIQVSTDSVELYKYYKKRGISKLFLKDYQRAIDDFNYVLSYNHYESNLDYIFFNLGKAFYNLKKYKKALKNFKKALKLNPKIEIINLYIGKILYLQGKMQVSIKYLEDYLSFDSSNNDAIYYYSLASQKTKKNNEAIDGFELLINKNNPYKNKAKWYYIKLLLKRGLTEFKKKNIENACSDFFRVKDIGSYKANYYIKKYCK